MTKITAQVVESGSDLIIVSLPPKSDTSLARKVLELSLFGNGIKGEILTDKRNQNVQQGNGHHQRGAGDKSSFTIVPNGTGATLADIVKRVQEEVDPTSMGVRVHGLHATRSGGVQVTFQNNKSAPSACFEKVQQCIATTATCHPRKGSVVVHDIEAVLSEKEILSTLAEALDVPVTRLEAGKISNSGEAGHIKSSCEKPAACFACKTAGHRGNSMACPIFRAQVTAKRK